MSKRTTIKEEVVLIKDKKRKPKNRRKVQKPKIRQISEKRVVPSTSTRQTSSSRIDSRFRTGHRKEFITSVIGSTTDFSVQKSIVLNAGSTSISNWLSGLAMLYESYKFHWLRLVYVNRCSSTTAGFVALSPDSNPHDPPPQTDFEAFQNEKTKSSASWDEFHIDLTKEMLSKRKSYFCRKNDTFPQGADIDLYDVGNIHLIVGGQQSTSVIGQLWIEYDVEFYTPEYANNSIDTILLNTDSNNNGTANPLGATAANRTIQQVGNLASINNNTITFLKPFHGLLNMKNSGTAFTVAPTINGGSTAQFGLSEDGFNMTQSFFNGGATAATLTSLITALAGQYIQLNGPASVNNYATQLSLTPCAL